MNLENVKIDTFEEEENLNQVKGVVCVITSKECYGVIFEDYSSYVNITMSQCA